MARADRRTADQIRDEIRAERAELDTGLAALRAEAKNAGRAAGAVFAGLTVLRVLLGLRGRRKDA